MDFAPVKDYMDMVAREYNPGNAIEVYLRGERVFRYVSGYSDWENKIPLTGDELYNIYSCSKNATVTAGLQLLEQGKIKLDDPLYEYIPEYREMYVKDKDGNLEKARSPITLFHLFTMTAGLTYDMDTEGFRKARELTGGKMYTLDVVRSIATDPLSFHPGEHRQYSLCHDVLGGVIEVVSGMRFQDYMKQNLFDPLNMTETCYHHTPETLSRTAEQYSYVEADTLDKQYQHIDKRNILECGEEFDSGGAGVISSLSDYAKFAVALANFGVGMTGERILTPESINLLRKNAMTPTQMKDIKALPLRGYGYGLGVRTHVDPELSKLSLPIGEFGWNGAGGCEFSIVPEIGLAIFYTRHMIDPREHRLLPELRSLIYDCVK